MSRDPRTSGDGYGSRRLANGGDMAVRLVDGHVKDIFPVTDKDGKPRRASEDTWTDLRKRDTRRRPVKAIMSEIEQEVAATRAPSPDYVEMGREGARVIMSTRRCSVTVPALPWKK